VISPFARRRSPAAFTALFFANQLFAGVVPYRGGLGFRNENTALGVSFFDTFFTLGTVRSGSGSSLPSTGSMVVSDGVFMFLRVVIEMWNYWGECECVIGEIEG
jgi:hypothetical protein